MFEFMLGAVVVFGVVGMVRGARRRRRCGHHGRHGGYGARGWGRDAGPSRGRGRAGFARAAGEVFKRRLDIDPDQEGIVDHALRDLQASLRELGETLKDSRSELADAFVGETVDDGALDAAFSRHDDELRRARHEVVSALKQIHAVLDPEQRARAAEWLGSGRLGWV